MTNPIVAMSLSSRRMDAQPHMEHSGLCRLASASPSPSPSLPVFLLGAGLSRVENRRSGCNPPVAHGGAFATPPQSAHRSGRARFDQPALGESSRGRPRKAARPLGQAKLVMHGGFRKLPPLFFNFDGTSGSILVAGTEHSSQGPFV